MKLIGNVLLAVLKLICFLLKGFLYGAKVFLMLLLIIGRFVLTLVRVGTP